MIYAHISDGSEAKQTELHGKQKSIHENHSIWSSLYQKWSGVEKFQWNQGLLNMKW